MSSQDKFLKEESGTEDAEYVLYPQAYLLHYLTYDTPRSGPLEPAEPLPFFDNNIKVSRIGLQDYVNLAKIKGAYLPEVLISQILTKDQNPTLIDKLFLNMDNHKLSALVPELRLYKVSTDGTTVKPFYFPVVSDYKFDSMGNVDLSNSFTSAATAIEDFSVTFTGKNPFQASRGFLDASLTVKVDNISTIFDTPQGPTGEAYAPIADLFTIRLADGDKIPGSHKKSSGNVLENGKSCRIVATFGYSPQNIELFTSQDLRAISTTFQVINLSYAGHDLNLQNDGSASISVKYTGFLEAIKGETQYDLVTNITQKARLQKAKVGGEKEKPKQSLLDIGELRNVSREADKKAKGTKKEEVLRPTTKDVTSAFKDIVDILFKSGKIHVISTEDLEARRLSSVLRAKVRSKSSATQSGATSTQDFAESVAKVIAKSNQASLVDKTSGLSATGIKKLNAKEVEDSNFNPWVFVSSGYFSYVAFGDLMDAYYQKIGSDIDKTLAYIRKDERLEKQTKEKVSKRIVKLKEDLKKLSVFMADAVYVRKEEDSLFPEQRKINIADIPISIDTFYTLVFEEMILSRKSFYDMYDFTNSFVPKLLTRSFNELPLADFINNITFVTTAFSGKKLSKSAISKGEISVLDIPSPIQRASQSAAEQLEEYIIIHQKPSKYTRPLGSGNSEEDLKRGIYHLRSSQNSGLVKNISFQRIPSPGRETYMIVRNGKIYDELRYAHNATVEMVGNNLFFPSCCVYIDPETLGFGDPRRGNSAARKLGFGGYYIVGPVTTKYSGGTLSTTLNLYFNSFPETDSQTKGIKVKDGKIVEEQKSINNIQNTRK